MYLKILLVIIIFLVIGISEIVPLVKQNCKKELAIYMIFFSAAFILMFLYSIGVELPQVSKGIDAVVRSIVKVE